MRFAMGFNSRFHRHWIKRFVHRQSPKSAPLLEAYQLDAHLSVVSSQSVFRLSALKLLVQVSIHTSSPLLDSKNYHPDWLPVAVCWPDPCDKNRQPTPSAWMYPRLPNTRGDFRRLLWSNTRNATAKFKIVKIFIFQTFNRLSHRWKMKK